MINLGERGLERKHSYLSKKSLRQIMYLPMTISNIHNKILYKVISLKDTNLIQTPAKRQCLAKQVE